MFFLILRHTTAEMPIARLCFVAYTILLINVERLLNYTETHLINRKKRAVLVMMGPWNRIDF